MLAHVARAGAQVMTTARLASLLAAVDRMNAGVGHEDNDQPAPRVRAHEWEYVLALGRTTLADSRAEQLRRELPETGPA